MYDFSNRLTFICNGASFPYSHLVFLCFRSKWWMLNHFMVRGHGIFWPLYPLMLSRHPSSTSKGSSLMRWFNILLIKPISTLPRSWGIRSRLTLVRFPCYATFDGCFRLPGHGGLLAPYIALQRDCWYHAAEEIQAVTSLHSLQW